MGELRKKGTRRPWCGAKPPAARGQTPIVLAWPDPNPSRVCPPRHRPCPHGTGDPPRDTSGCWTVSASIPRGLARSNGAARRDCAATFRSLCKASHASWATPTQHGPQQPVTGHTHASGHRHASRAIPTRHGQHPRVTAIPTRHGPRPPVTGHIHASRAAYRTRRATSTRHGQHPHASRPADAPRHGPRPPSRAAPTRHGPHPTRHGPYPRATAILTRHGQHPHTSWAGSTGPSFSPHSFSPVCPWPMLRSCRTMPLAILVLTVMPWPMVRSAKP